MGASFLLLQSQVRYGKNIKLVLLYKDWDLSFHLSILLKFTAKFFYIS